MGRWEPGARDRMRIAALDLFAERGYDETSVADIAARTGLTERTFYRHFADKREVVFDGQDAFVERFVRGVTAAPAASGPIATVTAALDAIAEYFPPERRPFSRRRQQTIDATVSLQERERWKLASLTVAVTAAFAERGLPETEAALAGELTISVFHVALRRWLSTSDGPELRELQRETLAAMGELLAGD